MRQIRRLRTWHLFNGLVVVHVALTALLNRVVLADASLGGFPVLSYAVAPVALLIRVAFVSLLVQLTLLALRGDTPYRGIFRAALWAEVALVVGVAVQTAWVSTLPATAILQGRLGAAPGSLAAAIPLVFPRSSPFAALATQVTVFDLGWVVLFALALEDGSRLRFGPAILSVGVVWVVLTLATWLAMLFLVGIA
jgi:hypothetical protein